MRFDRVSLSASILCFVVLFFSSDAQAFPKASTCGSCHEGFLEFGALHTIHANDMGIGCRDCHTSTGDDPDTDSSGNYENFSCNGCHSSSALTAIHPSSGDCTFCHSANPSLQESDLPYFYQEGRSSIVNPCRTNAANGGEDINGDGDGLDNDGDGLLDAEDPDCLGIVPNAEETWSMLKVLFDDAGNE